MDQAVIAGSVLACLAAVYAHLREKDGWALGLILLAAFSMRLMVAQLDPFLNSWDESVHAVVAKHMASHPFTPMLYSDMAMELGIESWDRTHIWLHKQPFFLWMMAISIKVFGNTIFALRLPSVLFTTALVFFTHGIARAMHGRTVAFIAAMLMAWSYWIMMLIIGAVTLDHNDAIFISLVGGAFWGWMRWRGSMSTWKSVAIGLFMGCAVLTKWLPGFLLMGGWAVVAMTRREGRAKELRWMTISFLTGLVVAIPWQISAWMRFPVVMAHEMDLNALHFTTVVEQHGGNPDYYLQSIRDQFHAFPNWLMFGALVLCIAMTRNRELRTMAWVSVLVTYGFYSAAATKMSAFPMVVIPFFFVGLAHLIKWVSLPLASHKAQNALMMGLMLLAAGAMVDVERIQKWHTEQARHDAFIWSLRGSNLHNLEVIDHLAEFMSPGQSTGVVIYNVPFPACMNMMYFHDCQATLLVPSAELVKSLLALGRKVIIVDPPEGVEAEMPPGVLYYRTDGNGFQQPPV
ncbi:MAG: glycosyltransferase family 39 protein [Flavobacteriales bacterium]|nr:glycosyltransferase family 39 protein [Flavobacteriales bacterium]